MKLIKIENYYINPEYIMRIGEYEDDNGQYHSFITFVGDTFGKIESNSNYDIVALGIAKFEATVDELLEILINPLDWWEFPCYSYKEKK